jgi:hypothetical protein
MANAPLLKMKSAKPDEVQARADLPEPAAALLAGCADSAAAFAALEDQGLLADAAKWAAHALPRREAVWWACMCARHTAPADQPDAERALLQAAELWVRKPSDENRRAAFQLVQNTGFTTPEAWAAVAAFWSGDSMSPLGQPVVPPPPDAAGRAVSGSVTLAALRVKPERQDKRLARFLESARDIADGGSGQIGSEDS